MTDALNRGALNRGHLPYAVTPPWRDSGDVPGWSWTEAAVGPATMQWSAAGAVVLLVRVLHG